MKKKAWEKVNALLMAVILCFSVFSGGTIPATAVVYAAEELKITGQPADYSGEVGTDATFSVTAAGTKLQYQWYYANAKATKWSKSSAVGSTTNQITVSATKYRDGQKYRCEITDGSGNKVTSGTAILHIIESATPAISITAQPSDYTGEEGTIAKFAVTAAGENLSYQWWYCTAGSSKWRVSGLDGNKTNTLNVPVSTSRNGQKYRCVISNTDEKTITSQGVTLTVGPSSEELSIETQPFDYTGEVGTNATFIVKAHGSGLKYQWYFCNANSSQWKKSSQSGSQTAMIKIPVISARAGQKYRCIVTGANNQSVTTSEAAIHVGSSEGTLSISKQPEDYSGDIGETAVFSVEASGSVLTYQWYYCNPKASTWYKSSQTGSQTASIKVPVTQARNGQKYHCVVKDLAGNAIISEYASLYVNTLKIISQPENYSGKTGEMASFSVTATGTGLSYQWYYSAANSQKWYKSSATGANSANLQIKVTENRNGQKYHCVITDTNGDKVTSGEAVLTLAKEESSKTAYTITYHINNEYIEANIDTVGYDNSRNQDTYCTEDIPDEGIALKEPTVKGFVFEGWHDGSGSSTDRIRTIAKGTKGNLDLYAHWTTSNYEVQFESDLVAPDPVTYTVNKGTSLPKPTLSNYTFVGWADKNGNLYDRIPTGHTGNITLYANWSSERNKTVTKNTLDSPLIYEDETNNIIYFAYEIGEIQNVPLSTIHNFGYISGDGVSKTVTETFSKSTSEENMDKYNVTIQNATTKSSNWTLSKDWTEATTVNQEWQEENGYTREEVETRAKSKTGNWNISSGSSGSISSTKSTSSENNYTTEKKVSGSESSGHSTETGSKRSGSLSASLEVSDTFTTDVSAEASAKVGGTVKKGTVSGSAEASAKTSVDISNSTTLKANVSGTIASEQSDNQINSDSFSHGTEAGEASGQVAVSADSTSATSAWNTSTSYGGSNTSSLSETTSTAISRQIVEKYGYGNEYIKKEGMSENQGLSSSASEGREYSSAVTYSKATSESVTMQWTTMGTKPGYHRWILAGTAHVFAIISYDISSQTYAVYTYSVMDDRVDPFEDYSLNSPNYDDHENGVISFEVPSEVAQYVSERTSYTSGLKVDQATGMITQYTGTDDCVVIPEYMNVDRDAINAGDAEKGDVVHITGLKTPSSDGDPGVFENNTSVKAVVLSDWITEIPERTFKGCSSLFGVTGGNVSNIGDEAFFDCTSIENAVVTHQITELGDKAFSGAGKVYFFAANGNIARIAMNSGAKQILLYTNWMTDSSELDNTELTTPAGTAYFEFNGNNYTYNDLRIVSTADSTSINKAAFVSSRKPPLDLMSSEVVLNQVSAEAPEMALMLPAENTRLGIQATITLTSSGEDAVLSRNLTIADSNNAVDGRLNVKGNILVCGSADEGGKKPQFSYGEIKNIDEDTFNGYRNPHTIVFDPNGGSVDEDSGSITVSYAERDLNEAIPIPERNKYRFLGWFTDPENGEQVYAENLTYLTRDLTLYARWELNTCKLTLDVADGNLAQTEMNVIIGDPVGTLPVPTKPYYTFVGWGSSAEVSEPDVSEESVFTEDATIYAIWRENDSSDWVTEAEVPEGADIVDTKWTYDETTTKTSGSPNEEGYTCYNTTSTWSNYGDWSGWSTNAVSGSDSRQVESNYVQPTYKTQYNYSKYTQYANGNGWAGPSKGYWSGKYCQYYRERGWSDDALSISGWDGNIAKYGASGNRWYNQVTREVQVSGGYWQYRYRDRHIVYTYYLKKVETKESTDEVAASDTISNIRKWVKYVTE